MNQLKKVLGFELNNYFRNKSYFVTTLVITIVLVIGLFVPNIIDAVKGEDSSQSGESKNEEDIDVLSIYDEAGVLKDVTYLNSTYTEYKWTLADSEQEVKDSVTEGKAKAGFIINKPTEYTYVVNNKDIYDTKSELFTSILSYYYRTNYMEEHGIDSAAMEKILATEIVQKDEILGKDSVSNYAYTYIMVMAIYFVIIMYGQLIATSVTAEKSNRAIEVLVTSTKTTSLIFGKVIAGVIASFIQVGVILGAGLIAYKINQSAWDGLLDSFLDIPVEVLVVFFLFLVIGFLFYSFLYASLGALVSKTEDVSKSIGPLMFVFMIGFFIAMFGMGTPDSTMIKVCSYIPFTSMYCMIIRVAMGSVTIIEIIFSLILLIASSIAAGILGAKIYRMGTLHYGNPIKLTAALKKVFKGNE